MSITTTLTKIVLGILALIGITLLLASCDEQPSQRHYKHQKKSTETVHVYQESQPDNSWIYWYIFYNDSTSTTYYYRSSTPVSNFSSVQFSSSKNGLPPEVEKEVDASKELPPEEVPAQEQNADMQQAEATDNEMAGDGPNDTSMSESSGDAGSASSDAGSSDSGGGGGDGGGGGGE
jgi:uncharacterized membrane protein YgcG